ncbi:hypothetical protein J3456_01870 [Sulfitobacter sp. NFXS29]|uniref:hypothetical protein n=1 Tax=Sulfitobacter sp. NFXS29 TaxID=2818438 RepID=UPI0032DE2D1C
MEELLSIVIVLVAVVFVLWIYILLPSDMAKTRGRSQVFWVLVSLLLTPLLAIVLLWLFGDAEA